MPLVQDVVDLSASELLAIGLSKAQAAALLHALATLRVAGGGGSCTASPGAANEDAPLLMTSGAAEKSAWMQCVTSEGYLYYYNVRGRVRTVVRWLVRLPLQRRAFSLTRVSPHACTRVRWCRV